MSAGGKSPLGAYEKGGGATVFSSFQNNSYRIQGRSQPLNPGWA